MICGDTQHNRMVGNKVREVKKHILQQNVVDEKNYNRPSDLYLNIALGLQIAKSNKSIFLNV